MRDQDPERYYAALNVSPDASAEEIRLSYEFIKRGHLAGGKVNDIPLVFAAYDVLSDPDKRKAYDNGGAESGPGSVGQALAKVKPLLGSTVTLAVTSVVFVAIIGLLFAPGWVSTLRSFRPGDDLVWKTNGAPIGRVLAFEPRHEFPGGIRAGGYRIAKDSGEPVWMPAGDLQRYGKVRSDG